MSSQKCSMAAAHRGPRAPAARTPPRARPRSHAHTHARARTQPRPPCWGEGAGRQVGEAGVQSEGRTWPRRGKEKARRKGEGITASLLQS